MKCKNCKRLFLFKAGDDFICSGKNSKPTKWKKDNIWLCLKGSLAQGRFELTRNEALIIASALCKPMGYEIIDYKGIKE